MNAPVYRNQLHLTYFVLLQFPTTEQRFKTNVNKIDVCIRKTSMAILQRYAMQ